MGVGAEVVGEVTLDMRQLPIDRDQHVYQPRAGTSNARLPTPNSQQGVQRPGPGECTEGDLEHARPVDANEWRIRGKPAFELIDDRPRVARLACQPRRPAKLHPVLMAIQLPDDLVVANLRIQKRHVAIEDTRCGAAVNWIEMPVHMAIRGVREVAIAEEIAGSVEDPVRACGCVTRGVGPARENLVPERSSG